MRIVVEHQMVAAGDTVWAKLSDVGNISDWLPDIAHSASEPLAVGGKRTCRLAKKRLGVSEIHEVYTEAGPRSLAYQLHGFPFDWHNHWAVQGDTPCTVRIETNMNLPWYMVPIRPILGAMMRSQNKGMLKALDRASA